MKISRQILVLIRKQNRGLAMALLVCVLAACVYTLSISKPYYALGDIFFGKYPRLYNVTLARFFFDRAAHPLIGTPAPYAFHQLSRTHFIQGDLTPALTFAREELARYPQHINTYYILGLTLGYMNREEEAINAFAKYVEAYPLIWAGRNDLAWLQFRTGDIDGALGTIEPAYQTNPDNPWVLNTYGVLLMNKGRYEEASMMLEEGSAVAAGMTPERWGAAYPGNDPRIYETGLSAMQNSLKKNLLLLGEKRGVDKAEKQ